MASAGQGRRIIAGTATAALLALATALAAHGCDLPEIAQNVCGNKVLETGEACDEFVDAPTLHCGAAGTEFACLHVCDGDSEYRCPDRCPDRHVCGLEGLCKRPTGAFVKSPERLGGGAEELSGGDLDGDHRMDVIRVYGDEVEVIFGAARGEPPATHREVFEPLFLPVAVQPSPPAPAQGEADGSTTGCAAAHESRADLIIPRFGLLSLRADGEQHLAPVSLPALRAPEWLKELTLIPVDLEDKPDQTDLVFHVRLEPFSALLYVAEAGFEPLCLTHGPPSDLSREVLLAHFDNRPESPCQDIVLGYTGHDKVEFYNPCRLEFSDDKWRVVPNACEALVNCPEDMPRLLDVGAPVARGPFGADLNADGHLDLLVQVPAATTEDCDPCYETRAAYGVGNGTFHSDDTNVPASGDGDNVFSIDMDHALDGAAILALGDLDGDGDVDTVTSRDVRLTETDNEHTVTVNGGAPWVEAIVADMNGNDLLDVIAVNETSKRAFFYNGVGDGALNPATIPTNGPLSELHVADVDGDLIDDVVAMVSDVPVDDSSNPNRVNEVAVMFGSPAGAPAPPVAMGQTEQALRLTTGTLTTDLLNAIADVTDGIADIGGVASNKDGTFNSVHVFVGRDDRQLRSPLALVDMPSEVIWETDLRPHLVRRVVAGRFDGNAETVQQLAVVTVEALEFGSHHQLWLAPKLGLSFIPGEPRLLGAPPTEGDLSTQAVWELGLYAAADIDGDGTDELVVIAPSPDGEPRSGYRIGRLVDDSWQWRPDNADGIIELPSYRNAGPTVPCRDPFGHPDVTTEDCDTSSFEDLGAATLDMPDSNGRLRGCDLDGDGTDELILLSREARVGEPEVQAKLYVHGFEGQLELTTDGFTRVPLALPENGQVYDFACVETDGTPGQELAVLSSRGVQLVTWAAAAAPQVGKALDETAGFLRVLAGDVDGDGLDDLVLGKDGATQLFHGVGQADVEEAAP